jgi:hypothetical protein
MHEAALTDAPKSSNSRFFFHVSGLLSIGRGSEFTIFLLSFCLMQERQRKMFINAQAAEMKGRIFSKHIIFTCYKFRVSPFSNCRATILLFQPEYRCSAGRNQLNY